MQRRIELPGLCGLFERKGRIDDEAETKLTAMLQSQQHTPWLKVQRQALGPFLAGRVHLSTLPSGEQPVCDEAGRFILWLDGEIYNRDELVGTYGLHPASDSADARFLLELYLQRRSWDFLGQVDGIFAIAVFDTMGKELTLVSDRLGLRPLYYWISSDVFAFASEVKSIAGLPAHPKKLDRLAIEEFLAYGYMLDDRTWFEDVRVLAPATILTITESGTSQVKYWSRIDVQRLPADLPLDEAVEEMSRLWEISVASRIRTKHRYSLQLSGGLDSRSILAAIPKERLPVTCVTMGIAGSEDVRIASQTALIRDCPQVVIDLDEIDDFLRKRERFVWLTDGMVSILHLHASSIADTLRDVSDFSLNGFIGDLVLGGSYLTRGLSPQEHLAKKYASQHSLTGFDGVSHIVREWQKGDLPLEWFAIYQRVRRFTVMGTVQLSAHIEQRKPFVAKELLLFAMGLPEEYRDHGLVYRKMLLTKYPDLYRAVPWQATGVPLDAGALQTWLTREIRLFSRRINKFSPVLGSFFPQFHMVDYAEMMRKPEIQSYITRRLLTKDARVREFVPDGEIQRLCAKHFQKKSDTHLLIGRLLTAEIYLSRYDYYI